MHKSVLMFYVLKTKKALTADRRYRRFATNSNIIYSTLMRYQHSLLDLWRGGVRSRRVTEYLN